VDPGIIQGLVDFCSSTSKFKKAALNIFVKQIPFSDIEHLRTQFHLMDVDSTGLLDIEELTTAMQKAGIELPQGEIDKILDEVNYRKNG